MQDWATYWAGRHDAGHRSQTADFLRKEADEKLYHLGEGRSLLDIGCGAADLLQFLAPSFERAVGVDFSPSMLDLARRTLAAEPATAHVELVEADDRTVWMRVEGDFDRITTAAVVQYFDADTLGRFIANCRRRLNPGGVIALFDVIDPRLMFLFERGVLTDRARTVPMVPALLIGSARASVRRLVRRWHRLAPVEMGFSHHPTAVARIARSVGLETEIVSSMYYEYRYHALLRRPDAVDD
jgi:cyclopropane-fatty-acyl-phospholipid synthase